MWAESAGISKNAENEKRLGRPDSSSESQMSESGSGSKGQLRGLQQF